MGPAGDPAFRPPRRPAAPAGNRCKRDADQRHQRIIIGNGVPDRGGAQGHAPPRGEFAHYDPVAVLFFPGWRVVLYHSDRPFALYPGTPKGDRSKISGHLQCGRQRSVHDRPPPGNHDRGGPRPVQGPLSGVLGISRRHPRVAAHRRRGPCVAPRGGLPVCDRLRPQ